jgi:hypothetical protein
MLRIDEYKFRSLMSSGNLDNYPPTASQYIDDNGVVTYSYTDATAYSVGFSVTPAIASDVT